MSSDEMSGKAKVPSARRAFEGIRVLEFAALIAGPSCGKYLADHGADVIKVERCPLGDISRHSNRTGARRSPMFMQHNAGKRSLCIRRETAT